MITLGYVLAGVLGVGIIVIGVRFLVVPESSATAFGIPAGADGVDRGAYLAVKGVRDIATGLITLALLALQDPRPLGWVALAVVVVPVGDAVILLRRGGSRALAYGMHGGTALVTALTGALLLLG